MAKNKMKICKHCGAEIAKSAKVCPVCGGKNKKPIFKRVWFWLVIAVILILAIGGGTSHKLSEDAGNMSEKDFKASCESLDYEDVMRNTDNYLNKKVTVTGKVVQVVSESDDGSTNSQYRVSTGDDGYGDYFDDDIVLYYKRGDAPKLLEDDIITIYGECSGTESYTTILGAEVTVPVITGAYVEMEE